VKHLVDCYIQMANRRIRGAGFPLDVCRRIKPMPLHQFTKSRHLAFQIEQLNAAKIPGHVPDGDTARWVSELSGHLAAKLVKAELIPSCERQVTTT